MRGLPVFLLLCSCIKLDALVFNGVHCSNVGPPSCEDRGVWDKVCATCDEPYDWEESFPWFDTMLEPGQSVRPIPNANPTDHRLAAHCRREASVVRTSYRRAPGHVSRRGGRANLR